MAPDKTERRELEYIRHGTASFIVNFNDCTGQVGKVSGGSLRMEDDFARHTRETIESSPSMMKWHFVVDNLNTHQSASLVRYVADESDIDIDLGVKRKSGILKSNTTRAACLSDASHRIVFHSTRKHASWVIQIEIWFSILVRKLLKRGDYSSIPDLKAKVLAFVEYFNRTMAKPFKWTYMGKALAAEPLVSLCQRVLVLSNNRLRPSPASLTGRLSAYRPPLRAGRSLSDLTALRKVPLFNVSPG